MNKEHKNLKLRSTPESLNQLEALIEDVCDANNLNQTYMGCITTATTEAFHNARIHGNQNNPKKFVEIEFGTTPNGVAFTVRDEGKGFDYQSVPNTRDDGKEKVFPGRGLFLIKSLSDSVQFNETGNEITIGFHTKGIDIETTIDRAQKFKVYKDSSHRIEQ